MQFIMMNTKWTWLKWIDELYNPKNNFGNIQIIDEQLDPACRPETDWTIKIPSKINAI